MKTALRILHLVPATFGGPGGVVGGAERYATELARHMAEFAPTLLVSFGDRPRREKLGRLNVIVLGPSYHVRGQRTNPLHSSLVRLVAGVHVVHCHQQHVLASSLAALACRLMRRRVFVSDLGGGGWDVSGYVSTDRWFHGHLHISEYSRTIFGHRNRPWAQVILGGVDVEKFSPDPAVRRLGSPLFVGRLLPHKGVNDLVNAVPPDMSLEIIGQAYDAEHLRDLHVLAARKQVTFRHDCDDVQLVQAYRRALCVVLPSVYRTMYGQETNVPELLGQALLEGMACGTPAVCTSVASLPEIVQDGVSGFVVPPNDPLSLSQRLRWLRANPERAAEMGRAARQRILEKFTWPVVVRRCLRAYAA